MKKFSDALWCALFAVVFICLYYFVPSLHVDSMLYGFFILLGATIAYLSVALISKGLIPRGSASK